MMEIPLPEEGVAISIGLHVLTDDPAIAAKAIDIMSRVVLGLTLEGMDVTLHATTFEVDDEDDGGEEDEDTVSPWPDGEVQN